VFNVHTISALIAFFCVLMLFFSWLTIWHYAAEHVPSCEGIHREPTKSGAS